MVSGCDAANLRIEISAGASKRLRLFPEQPEGGQAAAVRKGCEWGNFMPNLFLFNIDICGNFFVFKHIAFVEPQVEFVFFDFVVVVVGAFG